MLSREWEVVASCKCYFSNYREFKWEKMLTVCDSITDFKMWEKNLIIFRFVRRSFAFTMIKI